jgi:hypothetical protein
VPLDVFSANLATIVRHVRGMGVDARGLPPVVVLVTPPPVDTAAWHRHTVANHGSACPPPT